MARAPHYTEQDYNRALTLIPTEDTAALAAIAEIAESDPELAAMYKAATLQKLPPYKPATIPDELGIPAPALYGPLGDIAKHVETDAGIAYIAALCMCSPYVTIAKSSTCPRFYRRTNLYGVGLAKSGSLKGATVGRICECLFPEEMVENNATRLKMNMTLASEVALMTQFPVEMYPIEPAKICVIADELEIMIEKGKIPNSALFPTLCSLWNYNKASNVTKKETFECNVAFSFFGALPVTCPEDYAKFFNASVNNGLRRRIILAYVPKPERVRTSWMPTMSPLNPQPAEIEIGMDAVHWIDDWWMAHYDDSEEMTQGAPEVIMRVAAVSAAMGGEEQVSFEAITAACAFMDWQLAIRKTLAPNTGETQEGIATEKVMAACLKAQAMVTPEAMLPWRDVVRIGSLHRIGMPTANRIREALVHSGWLDGDVDENGKFISTAIRVHVKGQR